MATKKVNPKVIRVAPEVDRSIVPMDVETHEELNDKILAIRDTYAFVNVPLSQYMESGWGAFVAVRTGTDTAKSQIWLYRAEPGEPGSVPVTRPGTGNALGFSLALPLKKLKLRPAHDRQWDLTPIEQPIAGQWPAFILSMTERDSVPRDLKAEEAEAAKEKLAKEVAKKAEKLKAQLAKIDEADAKWKAKVLGEDLDEEAEEK